MTYILALIVTLGVLVTVHEFGHYWVARLSGVRILRFAVGFGKPIWVRKDRRGTEWAVALIPLGGYVRMLDERDGGFSAHIEPGDVSYTMLHPRWRIAIALGGPVANFVLAVAVYWLLAVAGSTSYAPVTAVTPGESPLGRVGAPSLVEIKAVDGQATRSWQEVNMALAARLGDTGTIDLDLQPAGSDRSATTYALPVEEWHRGVDEPDLMGSLGIEPLIPAIIGTVVADTPAQRAGLQPGDRLLAINGTTLDSWLAFQETISEFPGQSTTLLVQRGSVSMEIMATPDARDVNGKAVGFLGVGPLLNEVSYGPVSGFLEGVRKTGDTVLLTLNLLKKMVLGQVSMSNLSGPITIAKVAGDSARVGWKYFIGVLALLSVSLGVLNLLPIPVLDGGHVIFAAAEWVTGKPVSERVMEMGYQFGIFLVGGLMLLALYNDVARLFSS